MGALNEPGTLITNPHFCNPDAGPVEMPVEHQVLDAELSDNWRKLKGALASTAAFKNAGQGNSDEFEVVEPTATVAAPAAPAPANTRQSDEQWQEDMVKGRIPLGVPALYKR